LGWDAELAIAAGRIDLLIEGVREARGIAARRFARDALARGLMNADPGAVSEADRAAALSLKVDPSTVAAASAPRLPHAVAVPLVARDRGVGFVRQVHVAFDPVGLWVDEGWLDPTARRALGDALAAAARVASPPRELEQYRLVAAQPAALRRSRVDGPSLAAAALASAVSLWTERPVRDDTVVTGAVRGDAVLPVGEMGAKVEAAAAHGATRILVPAGDAAEARRRAGEGLAVVPIDGVEALLAEALAPAEARVHPDRAMDEARRVFSSGWRGYRWPTVRETLSRLGGTLPEGRLDLRVEALTRLAAAHRHLGDPAGSLDLLREAEAIAGSEEGRAAVPDAPLTYLFQHMAMTHRQLCRFEEATESAARSVAIARTARLRGELIKALGCAGLVAMSEARTADAIAAFGESLEVAERHDPTRNARTRAYLIEAHAAAGDEEGARTQAEAALAALRDAGEDGGSRESWVRTSWAGALLALRRPDEAIAALDVPAVRASLEEEPLPGLLARRHLGVALAEGARPEHGFEILAASPVVHGRALEPHLSFLAHLNVLFEARARLARGAWSRDVEGRAARALTHVPRHGRVEAFLGAALGEVRAQLEAGAPDLDRLDALLTRCARLG